MPVRWSRRLPSEPSSVTVIKDAAGRYFASFVVQAGEDRLPDAGGEVGIDLGLTHFAVLSDGRKIASPRFLRRAERKLRRAQQALSRKAAGSGNRAKARVRVARVHAQVAVGYDGRGNAVAAVTVWSAGLGRPGLLEPMGVHRDHRGHGYGTAITIAAASALREVGSSSAIVCTESSNASGVATYRSAGFRQLPDVPDLHRDS
jgi:GNAT superfamily N-acetyltransferase